MLKSIKVSFEPTGEQISDIEGWLIKEEKEKREGFYCNWERLKASFDEVKVAILSLNNSTIGFASWYQYLDSIATIDLVEVKPGNRKKGYGKTLVFELLEFLKKKNVLVAELQCAPEESEPVWKQLGFVDFPLSLNRSGNKHLYQVLCPTLELNKDGDVILELWDIEFHLVNSQLPTWTWSMEYKDGCVSLINPIIIPCDADWRLKLRMGERIIIDTKAKSFGNGNFLEDRFLIIKELSATILSVML